MPMTRDCVSDIRNIIVIARRSVVRHINTTMALAYWLIGRRIVVEEQKGNKRAAYGERLLERISRELSSEFCFAIIGSVFALWQWRRSYRVSWAKHLNAIMERYRDKEMTDMFYRLVDNFNNSIVW